MQSCRCRHFIFLLVLITLTGYHLTGCTDAKDNNKPLLGIQAGDRTDSGSTAFNETLKMSGYYLDEFYPPFWLNWTTDGSASIECRNPYAAAGVKCTGRYCDNVNLLCRNSGFDQTGGWWTDYFSEEGNNQRICDNNGFVTGIRCTGSYCDNMSLRCSQVNNGGARNYCYWTSSISEESGGTFTAPGSQYVAGVRCTGRYCDNMDFYICRPDEGPAPVDIDALARKFAPRLRFDQLFGSGSGDQSKCFPGDPQAYYEGRAQGIAPQAMCNQNYSTISNNQVPVFYLAKQAGSDTVLIRYWFFYAWQSTCFTSFGSHAADWESMMVMIVNGELKRVAYFQHSGWYTKKAGNFQTVDGTHPVAYVGKNAHGSFHDDGGSGGCLYFEDYRNPGGNDYHMDTWNNMVFLWRGDGAPSWMNCTGSGCFDGIGHPMERGDIGGYSGCNVDGCGKSDIGGVPFITDPTGSGM